MYYPFQTKLLDLKQLNYSIMKAIFTLLILLIPYVGLCQQTFIVDFETFRYAEEENDGRFCIASW